MLVPLNDLYVYHDTNLLHGKGPNWGPSYVLYTMVPWEIIKIYPKAMHILVNTEDIYNHKLRVSMRSNTRLCVDQFLVCGQLNEWSIPTRVRALTFELGLGH